MRAALLGLWLCTALPAQQAAIRAVFAADPAGDGPPALVWLRAELLPRLPGWPPGLDPKQPLQVLASAAGCRFAASALAPRGYLDGEFALPGVGSVLLSCDRHGVEDWFAEAGGSLPAGLQALLQRLGDLQAPVPKCFDAAALCGNLACGMDDDDPRRLLLTAGMRQCGEVTFRCWRQPDGLRVRGRSGGGLLLPALGAFLASLPDLRLLQHDHWAAATGSEPLRVRAFASRDGDRAEAARQLARTPTPAAQATLRAMLSGGDRLPAMDSLLRHGDPAQLVRILAAADPQQPASLDLARDAVGALWPRLDAAEQRAARAQLAELAPAMLELLPAPPGHDLRGRLLAVLAVLLLSLCSFWLRERLRPPAG